LTEGIEVRSLPVWAEMYEFVALSSTASATTDVDFGSGA